MWADGAKKHLSPTCPLGGQQPRLLVAEITALRLGPVRLASQKSLPTEPPWRTSLASVSLGWSECHPDRVFQWHYTTSTFQM